MAKKKKPKNLSRFARGLRLPEKDRQFLKEIYFKELDYDLEVKRIRYNFFQNVIKDLLHFLPNLFSEAKKAIYAFGYFCINKFYLF